MNEPLHEWRCPNCGAVTRARMADHPEEKKMNEDKKMKEAEERSKRFHPSHMGFVPMYWDEFPRTWKDFWRCMTGRHILVWRKFNKTSPGASVARCSCGAVSFDGDSYTGVRDVFPRSQNKAEANRILRQQRYEALEKIFDEKDDRA